MTKISTWLVLIVSAIAIYFWANQEKSILVQTINPEIGVVENTIANTRAGTISSCQRAKMSFSIGGQIVQIDVKEGDKVVKDQPLMLLWSNDRQAKVVEAGALVHARNKTAESVCIASENDKKVMHRTLKLLKEKLTSQEALDNAIAAYEASNASCQSAWAQVDVAKGLLGVAEASLEQTRLTAPFDGVVAEISGEVGEFTTPSPLGIAMPPAIDILTDDCHYVTAPIDEVDAGQLELGGLVRITLDAFRGKSFDGYIFRISPYVQDLEKQARTVTVDVRFGEQELPQLLTGYSADIEVVLESEPDVLRIPTDVIIDQEFVYVLAADNRVSKKKLVIGLSNWEFTQVISGLSQSDQVVSSVGIKGLTEGALAESQ